MPPARRGSRARRWPARSMAPVRERPQRQRALPLSALRLPVEAGRRRHPGVRGRRPAVAAGPVVHRLRAARCSRRPRTRQHPGVQDQHVGPALDRPARPPARRAGHPHATSSACCRAGSSRPRRCCRDDRLRSPDTRHAPARCPASPSCAHCRRCHARAAALAGDHPRREPPSRHVRRRTAARRAGRWSARFPGCRPALGTRPCSAARRGAAHRAQPRWPPWWRRGARRPPASRWHRPRQWRP